MGKLRYFVDNLDFDMLMTQITSASWIDILLNPLVLVFLVVTFALMSRNKTVYLGQQVVMYVPSVGFLLVTFVILKNDSITNTGPFIMAMTSFFIIIGWLIWTRLIKS